MSNSHASLKIPILCNDRLTIYSNFKTLVDKSSVIHPIVINTSNRVVEGLQCQQVKCLMHEVCEVESQTIIQEVCCHTIVPLLCRLPLHLIITDICQLHTDSVVIKSNRIERSSCSVVRYIIITADIKACSQFQVIQSLGLWEPIFICHHPTELNRREDGTSNTKEFYTTGICILTKATVTFCQKRYRCIIFCSIIIIATDVPLHLLPSVISTCYHRIVSSTGIKIWILVITCLIGKLCFQVVTVV